MSEKARTLREAGYLANLRCGGLPTPKPSCSFELETERAVSQWSVWVTGEADFDVMDAKSRKFVHHVWGMILDDFSFEQAFSDFLDRVMSHPTPGQDVPASIRTPWFSAKSIL